MIGGAEEKGLLPRSMLEITIVLIKKPDKDHLDVESYHPISLLYKNFKLGYKMGIW